MNRLEFHDLTPQKTNDTLVPVRVSWTRSQIVTVALPAGEQFRVDRKRTMRNIDLPVSCYVLEHCSGDLPLVVHNSPPYLTCFSRSVDSRVFSEGREFTPSLADKGMPSPSQQSTLKWGHTAVRIPMMLISIPVNRLKRDLDFLTLICTVDHGKCQPYGKERYRTIVHLPAVCA